MADYSIVSDTSGAVIKLLRENLCPELIPSSESITLVSPTEKNGDFQLGLYLYDLKELSEYRTTRPQHNANNTRTFPPKPMTLYYLLFFNAKAQISTSADMEQRIFGKAIQVLMDNSTLNTAEINPFVEEGEEQSTLSLLNLTFEEKTKLWSALSTPYQVGVYFTVAPVLISSKRTVDIRRVVSASFQAGQTEYTRPRTERG